jgi:hypothetical protein
MSDEEIPMPKMRYVVEDAMRANDLLKTSAAGMADMDILANLKTSLEQLSNQLGSELGIKRAGTEEEETTEAEIGDDKAAAWQQYRGQSADDPTFALINSIRDDVRRGLGEKKALPKAAAQSWDPEAR